MNVLHTSRTEEEKWLWKMLFVTRLDNEWGLEDIAKLKGLKLFVALIRTWREI